MIVTPAGDGTLRIVHQPEHAALSGELARRWRRPTALPAAIWPRFVTAVRRHDEGWREAERAPALDRRGRPHTFKSVPTPIHAAIWRQGIETVSDDDAYAGLIVALHARWLYTAVARGPEHDDAAAQALVMELDQQIDAWLTMLRGEGPAMRAAIAPEALDTARQLLGVFDALSLMLVNGLSVNDFSEPVAYDATRAALAVKATEAGLTIAPWGFEGEAFEVAVAARRIADRRYPDPQMLGQAIASAPAERLAFRIEPAG